MKANNYLLPAGGLGQLQRFACGLFLIAGMMFAGFSARAPNAASPELQTNDVTGAATFLPMDDQQFMNIAAMNELLEIKLGELAIQNASRSEVRTFAQQMVLDYSLLNNDLKALAIEKRMNLPAALNASCQKVYDAVAAYSGVEFENIYVSTVLKLQQTDALQLRKEFNTSDPELRNFVEESLPLVQAHGTLIGSLNRYPA